MAVDFVGEIAGHSFTKPKRKKHEGMTSGKVIANCDLFMQGRVQLRLAIAPELEPWATVAQTVPGSYWMPKVGDQVLVMFCGGDITMPCVVGVVPNAIDIPPINNPIEANTKRIIRTPIGHEIEFDDASMTLNITSSSKQQVHMDPDSVELSAGLGAASIKLTSKGEVKIFGALSIELDAPTISLKSDANVDIKAGAGATLNGGTSCTIQGGMVKIN